MPLIFGLAATPLGNNQERLRIFAQVFLLSAKRDKERSLPAQSWSFASRQRQATFIAVVGDDFFLADVMRHWLASLFSTETIMEEVIK